MEEFDLKIFENNDDKSGVFSDGKGEDDDDNQQVG